MEMIIQAGERACWIARGSARTSARGGGARSGSVRGALRICIPKQCALVDHEIYPPLRADCADCGHEPQECAQDFCRIGFGPRKCG
eukprot:4820665-Alexandrium_andersonii.AAC.1